LPVQCRLITDQHVHLLQGWHGGGHSLLQRGRAGAGSEIHFEFDVKAFFDTPLFRAFAQLDEYTRLPDESTILRFRHRLETHKLAERILATVNELLARKGLLLKAGTVVDATLIAAPSSTKNKGHARDPEIYSSIKGEQMYFGMKANIGVDAFGDAGYQGIDKRPDAQAVVTWHVAMRPGKRKALNKENEADALIDQAEKLKAGVRAKVEHPYRVIKRQFGFIKVRLSRTEEERRITVHAVCPVQLVDGAQETDGSWGMSAPANRAKALQRAKPAQQVSENDIISGNFSWNSTI